MKNSGNLNLLVILTVISIFIAGCKVAEEKPVTETAEEIADTGALVVESSPGLAEVYIGEEYRGDTPLILYNIPVGKYDITVKKQGYIDFEKTVTIKVGKTEEIDATLMPVAVEEAKPKVEEKISENASAPTPQFNKINLSSFAMFFDFENMQFTEIRTDKSDLFSRKYDNYVHFTAITPAKIYVLNNPIKDVKKEDCIFADTGVAPLFSGQTLCVKTAESNVVALGWDRTPNELEWVLFN